jgi:hypothetical protein
MTDAIKILFLTASPATLARLRIDRDYREVDKAIRRALERARFEIVPAPAARVHDLQESMRRHSPQIVHFSGHGDREGILLEDDAGRPMRVTGKALAGLFRLQMGTIRLVVLSACESESTGQAFHEFVDYTIGMRRKISDRAAIAFSTALYGALADGETIPRAFDYGVNAMQYEYEDEADVPELLRRPGASELLIAPARPVEQKQSGVSIQISHSSVDAPVNAINGDNNTVVNGYGMPKLR